MKIEHLGAVIATQVQRIRSEQMEAWECVLRLHIKPKPSWCPMPLWKMVCNLVLVQSEERK